MTTEERPERTRPGEAREAPRTPPPPGSIAELFAQALPGVSEGGRADLPRVMRTAKDDPRLDLQYLRCLSGVDHMEGGLEVIYHLYSYSQRHNVTIKTRLPLDDPRLASATLVWRGADWHEREAAEMFGITFDGHPNPVPLLLPEDMLDHHPLRKDNPLAPLEVWQGTLLGPEMARAGYIPPGSGFEVQAEEEGEE